MLTHELAKILNGEILVDSQSNIDYLYAFSTDLMSDALAMINDDPDKTILVTGLCNEQVLRTAEMLDIGMIIIVRGKKFLPNTIESFPNLDISIITSDYSMFEASGILFSNGIKAIAYE